MPSITLGLWPIAGITTVGVTETDAKETILAAIESGITSFDTAFSYGYDGESDRLLGTMIGVDRDRFTIVGKVGQRWNHDHRRVIDGTPATLIADAETSLRRIGIERFDMLMLHSPDSNIPIEQSAEAIDRLRRRGLCKSIGICNIDVEQHRRFSQVAGCDAIECPLNLMQRDSLRQLIPHCQSQGCDVYAFWTLMKGLLAGRISRDHRFAEGDVRPSYEIFQGTSRERTHAVLDGMKTIADASGITIAQLSIGWVLSQPGVTNALIGARRAEQVREIAVSKPLSSEMVEDIDQCVNLQS